MTKEPPLRTRLVTVAFFCAHTRGHVGLALRNLSIFLLVSRSRAALLHILSNHMQCSLSRMVTSESFSRRLLFSHCEVARVKPTIKFVHLVGKLVSELSVEYRL